MTNNDFLSVVVCTFNRAGLLSICLEALAQQTLTADQYEVIVVNNNSTDNTQQVVKKFIETHPNFRLVLESRQGHSYARNRGWQEARGEYVAYTDDDTRPVPEWCARIMAAFTTVNPPPAAVGGQIFPWYAAEPPSWFNDKMEIRTWGRAAGFLQPPKAQWGFSGANMAFPREILASYGGFSTDYGIVKGKLRMGEDTDLFTRIYVKEPLFWYDPEIIVYHWTPSTVMTLRSRFKRFYKVGESRAFAAQRQRLSVKYLRGLVGLALLLVRIPLGLFTVKEAKREYLINQMQELASRLGYLFGSI